MTDRRREDRSLHFARGEFVYLVVSLMIGGIFLGRVIEDLIDPHVGKLPLILHLVPCSVALLAAWWLSHQAGFERRLIRGRFDWRTASGEEPGREKMGAHTPSAEVVEADWSIIDEGEKT